MNKGKLISFEGGEGAGKTTLIEEVSQRLAAAGHLLVKTREPGGTPLSESIRDLLLHYKGPTPMSIRAELLLFLAARAQQAQEIISPALALGKIVLCDRYNDSSIAYQGLGRGLGPQKVQTLCEFATSGLEPHLTLYLDLDPALGLSRTQARSTSDRIESETLAFHHKIRDAYLALARSHPHRVKVLDASKEPSAVLAQAMGYIDALLTVHAKR